MKKFLALWMVLCLAIACVPVTAEETGLLETLLTGIEELNPEEELEIPEESKAGIAKHLGTVLLSGDIKVPGVADSGITFETLGTDERSVYLPSAGLAAGMFEALGTQAESHSFTVWGAKSEAFSQWLIVLADNTLDQVFQGWWTPGSATGEWYVYTDEDGRRITAAEFSELYDLAGLTRLGGETLAGYITGITGSKAGALVVGKATFEISSDKQSIFINKPSISGGSGSYKIAYNIYDNNSNPVNYFYSTASRVACTPGYGGTFNVFIVVTDTGTGKTNTQNIGWQKLNWPYASKLTVGSIGFEMSSDKKSVFINRPTIKCKGGSVTIAYNLYDSNSKPVNYFYSTQGRVAVTPGYAGKFNVFVTVTDTTTKETVTKNIGWAIFGIHRALIMCQTAVPGCTARPGYTQMNTDLIAKLKLVDKGAYSSYITNKQNLSRSGMLSAIASAYSGAQPGDVSFFWNATHGVTSNVSYTGALCTTESSTTMGYLYLSDLANALTKANPNNEVIVILSSCGSGAAVKGLGEEGEWSSQDANLFNRLAISAFAAADKGITKVQTEYNENGEIIKRRELCLPKFYVICSQDVYKSSWSYTTGRSIIGDALINGMTASSSYLKADSNKDHNVTFYELYKYIYDWCYSATSTLNPVQLTQRYPTTTEGGNYVVFTY